MGIRGGALNIYYDLGRIAYEAYTARMEGSLQLFEELPNSAKYAWIAAAEAVRAEVMRPRRDNLPEADGPDYELM
jgi:hypothetical protein